MPSSGFWSMLMLSMSEDSPLRVALISANLGSFDTVVEHCEQKLPYGVELTVKRFTDDNFPPRSCAMTPRLQARIPKMFGWDMVPLHDYYIWVDASCALLHEESVAWFLKKVEHADIAVFKHPDRNSIREEYLFIKSKIEEGNKYITRRYKNELLSEQYEVIKQDRFFFDNKLYASTAFIYHNVAQVRQMLREWWVHTSRYHSVDQLALPYVLEKSFCKVNVIEDNYLKCPYLTYTRNLRVS